ncbi:class I SAM-dependent methyltransferase [Oligoflexia bacterium]|nr:class I SAM-dependent methyltransferase [Oligoflexia bacterium]
MTTETNTEKNAFVLLDLLRESGKTINMHGEECDFIDFVGSEVEQMIYNIVKELNPQLVIELGLAHGCSALSILQGLADNASGGRLISMDPIQTQTYKGIAIKNIERAGLAPYHALLEERSEYGLPLLIKQHGPALRSDFIYIDTTHQYDQTMVEFFFCDKILNVGGLMAFDDYNLSSVQSACNFVETNRHYRPYHVQHENMRVLQKTGEDDRVWYHFIPFYVQTKDQMTWREKECAEQKK